jgi:molecular chaperone GrpE
MSHKHHKPSSSEISEMLKKKSGSSFSEEGEESVQGALGHPSYEELENKLNETETAMNEYKNSVLRTQAEMENMRRRLERDVSNAHKYSLEKFINELLPVMDGLERGLAIEVGDNEFAKRMHEGLEMTRSLMLKTLEKFSVKQIDPMGEPFNPELHQAISMQSDPSVAANTVINVMQKGYLLNDRLIRPALVIVSKPD